MSNSTFIFSSQKALHRPWLRVAEIIAHKHGLVGHVIAPLEFSDSPVWEVSGKLTNKDFDGSSTLLNVHFLCASKGNVVRWGFKNTELRAILEKVKPNYIYIHGEFWEGIAHQFLWHYRFQRMPRIVAHVFTNHIKGKTPVLSSRWPFLSRTRLKQIFLWSRLNGVAAAATKSMECARRIGLPRNVPVKVAYLPVFGPENAATEGIRLPWQRDSSFTIGFAGLLSEQKGWKVLLAALERLPDKFKVVLVGDGEQREELLESLKKPKISGRAYYAGLLPRHILLATYSLFDVFVLPCVSLPCSVEQAPNVVAEAMACGVPIVGSDSGGVPELVGQGGLIVPERDPDALAKAIFKMSEDKQLRKRSIAWGLERYRNHYSCEAYARSIADMLEIP
jgi:glycosyltransferase involved in cell wall biosynthesis